MKISISGKGGAGKTTLAAALALLFAGDGKKVFAIDCDPDANLAATLGYTKEITPITGMKELITERTGADPALAGGFFKLNPKVDDIPDKFAREHRGVKILLMGAVKGAGAGCLCPENAFVKNLLSHLVIGRDEVVILDMVAGCEHLGRATASGVDVMLVVAEPDGRSIETANRVRELAGGLGIKRILLVGNKIRSDEDRKFMEDKTKDFDKAGFLSFDESLLTSRGLLEADANLPAGPLRREASKAGILRDAAEIKRRLETAA